MANSESVACAQWAALVLPFVTTFLGAFLAFSFQNHREDKHKKKSNWGTALKTQALFYQFHEVILSIKREYLDAHKDDTEGRMLKIKQIGFCRNFATLDYEGLSFILQTKEPDILW